MYREVLNQTQKEQPDESQQAPRPSEALRRTGPERCGNRLRRHSWFRHISDTAAPSSTATATATSTLPTDNGAAQSPSPCELVTQADAASLAGTGLQPGVLAGAATDQSNCTYSGPASGPVAQVESFVGPGTKKYLDIDRRLGHVITPVPGLGDEAYQEDFTVFFRKKEQWYGLRLVRLDPPQKYAAALVELARTMATRI